MGLSFYGPSQNNPHVEIVRRAAIDDALMERMMLSVAEIDALHAHVHADDPKPKVVESVPAWCPTFYALGQAKAEIRAMAALANMIGMAAERAGIMPSLKGDMGIFIRHAQEALDHLGGGPVLKDDLDLDDDGGAAESSAAEDAEAEQKRADR